MGVKGRLAWNLKVDKVAKPLFQSTYRELMNYLIETCGTVEEINKKMKEIGFRVGEHLLMDYAERIRKHAKAFHEFGSTLQLAYKVNSGQDFTSTWISGDRRTIKFTDEKCPLCEGVEIKDMPGLQYCNLVSGVFQAVLTLRGFNGDAYQESCRAVGDASCTWAIKLLE
ncbi:MAG: hypothetical protein C4K49_04025 [Candidatus Thorarchaeota archaeon]|nr:MAG: hypothetical protein C4K49_04025 [Candidatus Thorarchaeota archaeon]